MFSLHRFVIAVFLVLPQGVLSPDGDIDIYVQEGETALMLLRDFNPKEDLFFTKVIDNFLFEVFKLSPADQPVQNASISKEYKDRVSLKEGPNRIVVELRDIRTTDVQAPGGHVYYQFQQKGPLQGPVMNIHIVDITFTADPNPVDEGKNVTLTCIVTSDQTPCPFHIPVDIIRMEEGNDRHLIHIDDGVVLTHRLDRVSPSDAGTYRCEVRNTTGSNLSLSVNYAPKFLAMKDKHVVAKGHPSAFFVGVTAFPLPVTFSWSKDGRRVPNTAINSIMITNDELQTTLSIPAVTEVEYGFYNITATNCKGNSSAIIQLAAESAPEPPYNLTVTQKDSNRHVHLHWTAGFNGGLDTMQTVQYRKVGGKWENGPGPARSNHTQYTEIFELPEKATYNIRIRAANRIEPAAVSNMVNVTIEDAATLYGRLPITNKDYSDYLQNLSSRSAVQLCTEVRSELVKVFNAIIGYEKSACDHFRKIETFTYRHAGDVMVEFHIRVAESEIASASSSFWYSIKNERLGEFNIDKDRAGIYNVKPKDSSATAFLLHQIINLILLLQIIVDAVIQMCLPKWTKVSTYIGPVITAVLSLVMLIVIYTCCESIQDRKYLALLIVSGGIVLYGVLGALGIISRRRCARLVGAFGLMLNYASLIAQLVCATDHIELLWADTTIPLIGGIVGGNCFLAVLLWLKGHFLERAQNQGDGDIPLDVIEVPGDPQMQMLLEMRTPEDRD